MKSDVWRCSIVRARGFRDSRLSMGVLPARPPAHTSDPGRSIYSASTKAMKNVYSLLLVSSALFPIIKSSPYL